MELGTPAFQRMSISDINYLLSILFILWLCPVLHMEQYTHSMPTSHFERKSLKSVFRLQSGKKKNPKHILHVLCYSPRI